MEEFLFGECPQVPDSIQDSDDRDLHRGFYYHNTEGVQREAWFHLYGCRRWTYVLRDTVQDNVV